jgi:hypothetical protein
MLNGKKFTEEFIEMIENQIKSYLEEFMMLYPTLNLTPKMHFMIHYGRAIREFGPPKHYSSMRFESKHSYFKKINRMAHNQINVTKTLAYRHQLLQLYHFSSSNLVLDVEYGPLSKPNETTSKLRTIKINEHVLEYDLNDINNFEENNDDENVKFYKHITYQGLEYHCNDVIYCLSVGLGIINHIFSKEKRIFFLVNQLIGEYHYSLTAYVVKKQESCKVIDIRLLSVPNPMDIYKIHGLEVISPKYPLN